MRLPLVLLALSSALASAQELADDTYTRIRDHILPSEAELRWTEVPWRATFWDAVGEAQGKEMPVLLWAMNGHPLACT
jgi:hypothetical protein